MSTDYPQAAAHLLGPAEHDPGQVDDGSQVHGSQVHGSQDDGSQVHGGVPADEGLAIEFAPLPPQTGDLAVDQAIDAVARALGAPLEEQLAVYEAAHRTLQDRLADVEG
jgi:hypothetical protein